MAILAQQVFAQQGPNFQDEVRPVLERRCLGCHNEKLKMSNLSLATRAGVQAGGKRGSALERIPEAIRHEGAVRMPPGVKLPEGEIVTLERWVRAGAPWPESAVTKAPEKPLHWSFQPVRRPTEPEAKNKSWVRTPVDRFILARLERERIAPSGEADKATLLRRLALDLTGLPPSPEEVAAFVADKSPGAWQQRIEGLLQSPHYGERWARHWLDQARYADSDGGSRDEPRQIWRYRDWVIRAFQKDIPFDRFVVEQLAGDLLPNADPEQLTATGFHRNSPIQIEAGTDREQYRTEAVVDRVDTTGTVFFGMAVGCARCHDHKFDPITHREYYQLYAFFNSSDDWGNERPRFNARFNNLIDVQGPMLEFAPAETIAKRNELLRRGLQLDEEMTEYRRKNPKAKDDAYLKEREAEAAGILKALPKKLEGTMVMRELDTPRDTYTMPGGDYLRKGELVRPGVPAFLHGFSGGPKANRLDLARWLVEPENPLLARVTVNRVWMQYFGRGLVETENDFGTQGTPPSHPELLDWLASEFVRSGWSQKHLHRLIVNSATYRQASKVRADLSEADPGNVLLARQSRLRLDAEVVRDMALSVSGLLTPKVGGPSVFPPQPEAAMSASQIRKVWKASTGEDRYRRGMYTFYWRVTPHPALVVFDEPNAMTACTRRSRSNTPLQALTLLNDQAFHEMAQAFALRLMRQPVEGRLEQAFLLAYSRKPTAKERERMGSLLAAERDALATRPEEIEKLVPAGASGDRLEIAAWVQAARVLMNTDEFITRE